MDKIDPGGARDFLQIEAVPHKRSVRIERCF
jgi:hypothetical protein